RNAGARSAPRVRNRRGGDDARDSGHLLVFQEKEMVLMASTKSSFLDKVLGRIGRLDAEGVQTVVQRLARERSFLETLFNTIEDGVLVLDESGTILYFNQAVSRLLGPHENFEGQPITDYFPHLDWQQISKPDSSGAPSVIRHEFELSYPRPRFLRLYAAPLDGERVGSAGVALIIH